jgi:hypothetical protein
MMTPRSRHGRTGLLSSFWERSVTKAMEELLHQRRGVEPERQIHAEGEDEGWHLSISSTSATMALKAEEDIRHRAAAREP